jgi:hypothetical protein
MALLIRGNECTKNLNCNCRRFICRKKMLKVYPKETRSELQGTSYKKEEESFELRANPKNGYLIKSMLQQLCKQGACYIFTPLHTTLLPELLLTLVFYPLYT